VFSEGVVLFSLLGVGVGGWGGVGGGGWLER